MTEQVGIQPLKSFAKKQLTGFPILRQVILEESDEMETGEFVAKMGIWLQLLRKEQEREAS